MRGESWELQGNLHFTFFMGQRIISLPLCLCFSYISMSPIRDLSKQLLTKQEEKVSAVNIRLNMILFEVVHVQRFL